MQNGLVVRAATAADAAAAAALLRESITRLCVLDHRNDPATLERWLSNKTPEHFLRWLADPSGCLLVASDGSELCGVGSLHEAGELRLCYVRVGWQNVGVGRAVIEALEAKARAQGLAEVFLTSSSVARSFYERLGYRSNGVAFSPFGVLRSYPYSKQLG